MRTLTLLSAYGEACLIVGVSRMVLEYATATGNVDAHRQARAQLDKRMRQLAKFEDKLIARINKHEQG
ncbi:MAG: hypothetical protein GWN76_02245 [candidate division Zixibacteria bacterium]|nr:hypothetical protein [candidate division Zixibacteria bacterium]